MCNTTSLHLQTGNLDGFMMALKAKYNIHSLHIHSHHRTWAWFVLADKNISPQVPMLSYNMLLALSMFQILFMTSDSNFSYMGSLYHTGFSDPICTHNYNPYIVLKSPWVENIFQFFSDDGLDLGVELLWALTTFQIFFQFLCVFWE